jgi:hypothetical protein
MAFTKMTADVENISKLPDVVSGQASELKENFDKASVDLKTSLNGLIDELEGHEASSSIGAEDPITEEETTVQGALFSLKSKMDIIDTSKQPKNIGEANKSVITDENGDISTEDKTVITLNGEEIITPFFYAPTTSGDETKMLVGNVDGEPQWANIPEGGSVIDNLNSEVTNQALSANQGRVLKLMIEDAPMITLYEGEIPSTGWVGEEAPYTVEVSVTGMLSSDEAFEISPVYDSDFETRKAQNEAWNLISKIDSGTDKITVTCDDTTPEVEIPIQIKVTR